MNDLQRKFLKMQFIIMSLNIKYKYLGIRKSNILYSENNRISLKEIK